MFLLVYPSGRGRGTGESTAARAATEQPREGWDTALQQSHPQQEKVQVC